MDDPSGVRSGQPAGDRAPHGGDLERRELAAAQDGVAERLATKHLHRDVSNLAVDAGIEHLDDGRISQPRERHALLLEPRHELRRGCQRQHLERDGALETLVHRAVHGPHGAGPHEIDDSVATTDDLTRTEDAGVTHWA